MVRVGQDEVRLRRKVFVEVMQPVYCIAQTQRLVGADEQLALILIEGEELTIVGVSLFVLGQVFLDVLIDGKSARVYQFVEAQWVLSVVDLFL